MWSYKVSSYYEKHFGTLFAGKSCKCFKKNWYYSVSSDASNIGNVKLYPYAVQYFDIETGICKKILDFYEDPHEASIDIYQNIIKITNDNNLKIVQITAYSADNAAVNFGVRNSVFQKLKNDNEQIIKANCNCHVINNCLKKALNVLSIDVETIIIRIFNEFSSSALTTQKLKECFEFANIEYKNLLRHVPTRWLSLLPAIDRLVYSWPAVKRYFLKKGKQNCRKVLWDFVAYEVSDDEILNEEEECLVEGLPEAYLYFVHNVLHEFHLSILALESDSCTILEIYDILNKLLLSLQNRINDNFYGSKVKAIMKNLSVENLSLFKSEANEFLTVAVNYLKTRFDFSDSSLYRKLSFLNLKKSLLSWELLVEILQSLKISNAIDNDKLYTDYCCLREAYKYLPKDISNDQIWRKFFIKQDESDAKNLRKLISFVFSIPVSNAFCEKTFSVLNHLYSKERNRMSFDLMKAELMIRINFSENCKNFQSFLQTEEGIALAKTVSKNNKYMWQNKST